MYNKNIVEFAIKNIRRQRFMKISKNIINLKCSYVLGSMLSSFALMITALNVNTTCAFIAHQPEIPNSAKRLRKF